LFHPKHHPDRALGQGYVLGSGLKLLEFHGKKVNFEGGNPRSLADLGPQMLGNTCSEQGLDTVMAIYQL
jgi:hypothetical protein